MLRRLRNKLPLKVLMSLYHTLIASYINYGCLIWASNFQSNYRRVQVQQNKAIRILGNYDRGSASTVSIYKKFDILDVGKIRDMQIGILIYQCLHNLGPDIFNDFFLAWVLPIMIMTREIQIILFISFGILPGRLMSSDTWDRPSGIHSHSKLRNQKVCLS